MFVGAFPGKNFVADNSESDSHEKFCLFEKLDSMPCRRWPPAMKRAAWHTSIFANTLVDVLDPDGIRGSRHRTVRSQRFQAIVLEPKTAEHENEHVEPDRHPRQKRKENNRQCPAQPQQRRRSAHRAGNRADQKQRPAML